MIARYSRRQCSRRRRSRRLTLKNAVRRAVDVFFQFTHRNSPSRSLWSETEQVWLGRATYLDWAFSDPEINIPWVVARAADAPGDADELGDVVREELTDYWTSLSACLPCETRPRWLPLP